uniref:Uncharacterized protein n=1 Tax=Globisporangium ultimum (strain ATCC 200006 / CBS 805.95 / DAOM BR144) TaxID=431595 RepID=K3WSC7_GLOUD
MIHRQHGRKRRQSSTFANSRPVRARAYKSQ